MKSDLPNVHVSRLVEVPPHGIDDVHLVHLVPLDTVCLHQLGAVVDHLLGKLKRATSSSVILPPLFFLHCPESVLGPVSGRRELTRPETSPSSPSPSLSSSLSSVTAHLVNMEPDVLRPAVLDEVLVLVLVPPHEEDGRGITDGGEEIEDHG